MREIREVIFRGKRTDNGEWIEGDLKQAFRGNQLSSCGIMKTPTAYCWRVDPETVGQFTGLTDKNGVRIFEGDIVHCVSKLDSADMVIIFECGQFRMILAEKYHEYQTNVGYYDINCFAKEVIGNIHDNPELLGGENNGINR